MITSAGSGHPGSSLSTIELIGSLFFSELKEIDLDPPSPTRDRFILSKGHAVPALYAVFEKKGWIKTTETQTLRRYGSRLQGHPDRVRLPQVEASTGSLGQGLSVAQGLALGLRLNFEQKKISRCPRVFCLIGDGECQEGQLWEAAMSASHFKLSQLCAILDHNGAQIDGRVEEVMPLEPLVQKWESFGWKVIPISDGHDLPQIQTAWRELGKHQEQSRAQPVLILAKTVKGKGVSFMEGQVDWHGRAPTQEENQRAQKELSVQALKEITDHE